MLLLPNVVVFLMNLLKKRGKIEEKGGEQFSPRVMHEARSKNASAAFWDGIVIIRLLVLWHAQSTRLFWFVSAHY